MGDFRLYERVATLEEKAETQDDINKELLKAVNELNAVLHQNKGALKLIGAVITIGTFVLGILVWLKN